MNFLAHIFLTKHDEAWMVGNYLADLLKNKDLESLPIPIRQGVMLHRKIDSFTDSHPLVQYSTRLLHEKHHKYANVLMDVFYDYLLYQNWHRYGKQDFIDFKIETYEVLQRYLPSIPKPLQPRTLAMIEHDWLTSYTSEKGIYHTFEHIKKRASKPELFEGSVDSLKQHFQPLNEHFNLFFPDLMRFVNNYSAE
ncbi:MAG: DUF479 domain-containing protein [Saprospiraceae bacterium]|nr:DUF479 domain-containing protein [Saprospiraceae bacterium]